MSVVLPTSNPAPPSGVPVVAAFPHIPAVVGPHPAVSLSAATTNVDPKQALYSANNNSGGGGVLNGTTGSGNGLVTNSAGSPVNGTGINILQKAANTISKQ